MVLGAAHFAQSRNEIYKRRTRKEMAKSEKKKKKTRILRTIRENERGSERRLAERG